MIKSPLTNKENTSIEQIISSAEIIDIYKSAHNIDVTSYLKGVNQIYLCKDNDSGYKFFYPEIKTDSGFYEELEKNDWYYMNWKWEFDQALKYIKSNSKILEIGCGKGDFLKRLDFEGHETVGLELNIDRVSNLRNSEIEVYCENVQEYGMNHKEEFDVVVCFQVLEHIYDVNSFIFSALHLLKKNGKLIISVPNNESFIKYAFPFALNIPPHHLGIWNSTSLKSLSKIFNLEIVDLVYEPLQKYHFNWYYGLIRNNYIKKYGILIRFIFVLFRNNRYTYFLSLFKNRIKGLTVLSVYNKN